MNRLLFLTVPNAAHGFALAGFQQRAVEIAEAEAALLALVREPEPALVVVDERLLPGIDPERFAEMGRRYGGALSVLPAPGGKAGEADYAERLIAQAVGYQLRVSAEQGR